MTDGLRKSHLRKAPQVGLSEVGLPEDSQKEYHAGISKTNNHNFIKYFRTMPISAMDMVASAVAEDSYKCSKPP